MVGEAGRRSAGPSARTHPSPGTSFRMTLAGTPPITEWSGIVPRTTEPAATTTLRPMRVPGSTTDPWPIQVPEPIDTGSWPPSCLPMGVSGSE